MESLPIQMNSLLLRRTTEDDLDFVLLAERDPENAPYIGQWSRERHADALHRDDLLHLILESSSGRVGYAILAGLGAPARSIELMRLVVTEKNKGIGRSALRLLKQLAFEHLRAHRLWLDVRQKNARALYLYQTEGFVREGLLRDCVTYAGNYESLIVLSMLEDEYQGGTT